MSSTDHSAMKHKLAELPDLVWPEIFKFLEYDDLLNILTLKNVCSELKDLVSLYVKSKTGAINQENESYEVSSFDNDYLVGKSLIGFRMNSDLHLSIKGLVLYNPLMLFDLIGFYNLTNLVIYSSISFKRPIQIKICLKNLEYFEAEIKSDKVSIVLEAPNLSFLHFEFYLDGFQILHLHLIQELIFWRIKPVVKQMVNLVNLNVYQFKISDTDDLFGKLKKLRPLFILQKRG